MKNSPKRLLGSLLLNKKRIQNFGVPVTPWEKFLTFRMIIKSKKSHNELKNIWKSIKTSKEFKDSLKVDEVSIYELVKDDFDELFNSFKMLAAIAMIESTKKITEVLTPSEIIMHDEYGAFQLSFLNAAKKNNIPTLSVQHGAIYENMFAYYHNKEEIEHGKKRLKFPIPDKMCVWSENARKALITSANFLLMYPS